MIHGGSLGPMKKYNQISTIYLFISSCIFSSNFLCEWFSIMTVVRRAGALVTWPLAWEASRSGNSYIGHGGDGAVFVGL